MSRLTDLLVTYYVTKRRKMQAKLRTFIRIGMRYYSFQVCHVNHFIPGDFIFDLKQNNFH